MDPIKHFFNSFNVDVIGSEIKAYLGPDKWSQSTLHLFAFMCVKQIANIFI